RDLTVTGVQTCALPIWRADPGQTGAVSRAHLPGVLRHHPIDADRLRRADPRLLPDAADASVTVLSGDAGSGPGDFHAGQHARSRSEERRVGKGWRCRWR